MEIERIENLINRGFESKVCRRASEFEVELSKLITACTLMKTMNVEFDFQKDEEGVKLSIFSIDDDDSKRFNDSIIDLNKPLVRKCQLSSIINSVHKYMNREGLLTEVDCISKNDDIFWTALDYSANNIANNTNEKDIIVKRLEDKALEINTFRKICNAKLGYELSEYESALVTILACMNFYANTSGVSNPYSRLSVNAKSYFRSLDDFECINRAIKDNCKSDKDVSLNDYIGSFSPLEDRKASYLVGLYASEFSKKNSNFDSKNIDVSKADFLEPEENEII